MFARTILKNAFANVLRGSAVAAVALALPPLLTRALTVERYGVWALTMQLTAYVAYFDFGIQTAVGRFVAQYDECGDADRRDALINTAIALLSGAALIATVLIGAVCMLLP